MIHLRYSFWLQAACSWLLASGYWLLVAGCLQSTEAVAYCLWIKRLPEASSQ